MRRTRLTTTRTWGREMGMRGGHRPQWLPGGSQLQAGLPSQFFSTKTTDGSDRLCLDGSQLPAGLPFNFSLL